MEIRLDSATYMRLIRVNTSQDDPYLSVAVEIGADGFRGTNPLVIFSWREAANFISELAQIERLLTGAARLDSLPAGECALRFAVEGGARHIAFSASLQRETLDSKFTCQFTAEYIEPIMLAAIVRDFTVLLAAADNREID